jgi:hypothetical protein
MSRNTAAAAVCGRIAQLPAHESARETRPPSGTTFCASRVAAKIRASSSADGSTRGSFATLRVARSPE